MLVGGGVCIDPAERNSELVSNVKSKVVDVRISSASVRHLLADLGLIKNED